MAKSKLDKLEVAQWTEAQAMQFGRDHAAGKLKGFDEDEPLEMADFPAGNGVLFYAYEAGFNNPAPAAAGEGASAELAESVKETAKAATAAANAAKPAAPKTGGGN